MTSSRYILELPVYRGQEDILSNFGASIFATGDDADVIGGAVYMVVLPEDAYISKWTWEEGTKKCRFSRNGVAQEFIVWFSMIVCSPMVAEHPSDAVT